MEFTSYKQCKTGLVFFEFSRRNTSVVWSVSVRELCFFSSSHVSLTTLRWFGP